MSWFSKPSRIWENEKGGANLYEESLDENAK